MTDQKYVSVQDYKRIDSIGSPALQTQQSFKGVFVLKILVAVYLLKIQTKYRKKKKLKNASDEDAAVKFRQFYGHGWWQPIRI